MAQRKSTGEYPVPDFDAIETKEKVTVDDWTNKKRWYIVAGLNKDFDIFDCQEHFFVKGDDDKMYIKINWRVNRPNGQFYERGDVQRFYEEDNKAIFLNRGNPETKLHYQDDWIVPKDGFYVDEEKGVAFVYYRGTNDAWDGYGGAVVYATDPILRPEFIPRMKAAAEKVNVDWNKMVITNNSCKAPEEVKVTNIADLDTLGDDVKAVGKVVERDVENITEKLVGRDAEKILEMDITKIEKALGAEIKTLENNLFRLEQATEQKIAGPQRAFGNEDGRNDVGFDINLKKAEKKLVEVEKEVRRADPNTNGFDYRRRRRGILRRRRSSTTPPLPSLPSPYPAFSRAYYMQYYSCATAARGCSLSVPSARFFFFFFFFFIQRTRVTLIVNTITFDMSSSLSSRASTISSTTTSFHSSSRQSGVSRFSSGGGTSRRAFVVSNAAQISFVRDSVETCVPDVKLTKSRDGTSGTAFFTFENPDVFEGAQGDITGMYMADEEGEMTTVRVVVFDRFRRISSHLI